MSPEFPLFLPAVIVLPDRAPVPPAEPLPCFPFPILMLFPWFTLFELALA